MMKRNTFTVIGAAVVLGVSLFAYNGVISKADSSSISTIDDPLITKSYLDQQLAVLVKEELAKQADSGPEPGSQQETSAEITIVQLEPGQTLFAKAGAEFIVRTGTTVAVSTDGEGIPDVTAGTDVVAGTTVDLNHLLVFPRDGRGVKAAAKTDPIYIMVRGEHFIQDGE